MRRFEMLGNLLVVLAPNSNLGVQLRVSRKALKQSGAALEAAIRRDMNSAMTTELDKAIFLGTGADGQPLGVITGAATYGITSTAVDALADWAAFRAGVTRFMLANAAASPSAVRALIRPELWDFMDGAYIDTGTGMTEWDRLVKHIPAGNIAMSHNALADPAGTPSAASALLTTSAGGVAPILVGLWGAVDVIRDPYTDAQSGGLRITALATADVTVARPAQLELARAGGGVMSAPVFDAGLELRAAGDGSRRLRGKFPYRKRATMDAGGRGRRPKKEQFAPRAFGYAVADPDRDVHLLVGHDFGKPLASRSAGTLALEDGNDALTFEATLTVEIQRTSWVADFLNAFAAGLIVGISPGFRVAPPEAVEEPETVEEEDPAEGNALIRTIIAAVLFELSMVTRPAYRETEADLRHADWQRRPSGLIAANRRWRA